MWNDATQSVSLKQTYIIPVNPIVGIFSTLTIEKMPSETKLIWLIYMQRFSGSDFFKKNRTVGIATATAGTVRKLLMGGVICAKKGVLFH